MQQPQLFAEFEADRDCHLGSEVQPGEQKNQYVMPHFMHKTTKDVIIKMKIKPKAARISINFGENR